MNAVVRHRPDGLEVFRLARYRVEKVCHRPDGLEEISPSTGEYKYYLRPHDVEEFHGVVQRYGASPDVQKMVELANDGPTIGKAKIAHACGTCLLKLA